jgi:hypothetical protein
VFGRRLNLFLTGTNMQGASVRFVAGQSSSGKLRGVFATSVAGACAFLCLLVGLALVAGCSQRASRVQPVEINASSASSEAMELYDKNADGALAGDELNAVPGIKKHLDKYDRDSDQRVTRDEISTRLSDWSSQKIALMGRSYIVTLDGRALEGASITLVPEPYLGENVKQATGDTGPGGLTRMSHAEEDLPKSANGRPLYGVKGGTFKIQITHPSRKIPAKYNTATELGDEIAYDINTQDSPITLALTSN